MVSQLLPTLKQFFALYDTVIELSRVSVDSIDLSSIVVLKTNGEASITCCHPNEVSSLGKPPSMIFLIKIDDDDDDDDYDDDV